jgi:plastocyanin
MINDDATTDRTWSAGRLAMVGVLAALLIVAAGLAGNVLNSDDDDALGMVFIVPAGSRARVIPEFESAIPIPTAIRFESRETAAITIINQDDVTHRAGPFLVGAGQTYTQRFDKPGSYPIACTVDPAESIVVSVEA